MKVFSKKIVVRRYRYKHVFGGVQRLQKEIRLVGFLIMRTTIDEEDVPGWAEIQVATLGSTDWKSKFVEYM